MWTAPRFAPPAAGYQVQVRDLTRTVTGTSHTLCSKREPVRPVQYYSEVSLSALA